MSISDYFSHWKQYPFLVLLKNKGLKGIDLNNVKLHFDIPFICNTWHRISYLLVTRFNDKDLCHLLYRGKDKLDTFSLGSTANALRAKICLKAFVFAYYSLYIDAKTGGLDIGAYYIKSTSTLLAEQNTDCQKIIITRLLHDPAENAYHIEYESYRGKHFETTKCLSIGKIRAYREFRHFVPETDIGVVTLYQQMGMKVYVPPKPIIYQQLTLF